jgi:Putative lumazine-binding
MTATATMTANAVTDASTNADLVAIRALAQTYFDGLYEGDADKLAAIFLPTSALTQSHEGKSVVTPRDQWLAAVRSRGSAKSQGLAREDHVLSIDLVGPTMALVKVKCQLPPRYFTDLLSLLKVDGQWQVAQKVFQSTTRS